MKTFLKQVNIDINHSQLGITAFFMLISLVIPIGIFILFQTGVMSKILLFDYQQVLLISKISIGWCFI